MMQANCLFKCAMIVYGIALLLAAAAYAETSMLPINVKLSIGKASIKNTLDPSKLTTKGYTVNNATREINQNTYSMSAAYRLSPKLNVEMGLQNLGRVDSVLDLDLPADTTTQQAADDIVSASQQQAGGAFVTLAGTYVQPLRPRLDLRAGVGLVAGRDNHRMTINGEAVAVNNFVYAPFLTLGSGVQVTPRVSVTLQAERYFLGGDPLNRYAIGLSYIPR